MSSLSMNRRDFARLFTLGGSAALLGHPVIRELAAAPARPLFRASGAPDWEAVRGEFLMPRELAVMNAANLCPSSRRVLKALQSHTETLDRNPVPSVRDSMLGVKEWVREEVAEYLRVSPDEILLTRNTSEANNWVSAGLDLGPGDEVVILADNHPSNNLAWKARGERFGFQVREVADMNPHPGPEAYLEAFRRAITPATRVVAFSHLTNTVGDLLPAEELCRMAREREVLTLVDGAQSFGLMDVDLSSLGADFYTGSAHKWPCGPKETGILFASRRVHDRFWPTLYSAYPGGVGLSRSHEGMGQRDEPALQAFGEAIRFLKEIGPGEIEARSRALTDAAVEGLQAIDGVHVWTSPHPDRRVAVVSFQPGSLEPRRVLAALEEDGVAAASRGGTDRPGIRFSPHFYNDFQDVERGVEAIRRYMGTGL